MKKRILSVGMAALMLGTAACSLPAATVTTVCAADVSAALEKLKYKVVDGESITITYCDQSVTEIEIPAEIEGMPVTAIGQSAFFRCTSLKSVVLPDSVTEIQGSAFMMCSGLTSVTFSKNLKTVGSNAFLLCTSLAAADFSAGLTTIGTSAFESCKALAAVILPEGLTTIEDNAFRNCAALKDISFPESVTAFGAGALGGTAWLKEQQAKNPLVVVNNIFIDVSAAEGAVIVPDGIAALGGLFSQNQKITSITIPDTLTAFASNEFYNCTALTEVKLPETFEQIGTGAFSGCTALTKINIPESVTTIGKDAFQDTAWLTAKRSENPIVTANGIIIDVSGAEGEIVIPDGVTDLKEWFRGNEKITAVTIPSSVKKIGYAAFDSCSALTAVKIADGVESIGEWAFSDCPALITVTVPDSITHMEGNSFDGSDNLTLLGSAGSYAESFAQKYDILFSTDGKPVERKKRGDLNGDGEINLKDVVSLRRAIAGGWNVTAETAAADVNGDGAVNLKDVVSLRRYIAGGWNVTLE